MYFLRKFCSPNQSSEEAVTENEPIVSYPSSQLAFLITYFLCYTICYTSFIPSLAKWFFNCASDHFQHYCNYTATYFHNMKWNDWVKCERLLPFSSALISESAIVVVYYLEGAVGSRTWSLGSTCWIRGSFNGMNTSSHQGSGEDVIIDAIFMCSFFLGIFSS